MYVQIDAHTRQDTFNKKNTFDIARSHPKAAYLSIEWMSKDNLILERKPSEEIYKETYLWNVAEWRRKLKY